MSFDMSFEKVLENLVLGGKQQFPFYNISRKMKRGTDITSATSTPLYQYEPTDYFRVSIAVAGYKKEEVEVSSSTGVLTVRGTKRLDNDIDYPDYRWSVVEKGLSQGSFVRKFKLPRHAVVNSVTLEDGILDIEIEIKTPETEKPVRYEIK